MFDANEVFKIHYEAFCHQALLDAYNDEELLQFSKDFGQRSRSLFSMAENGGADLLLRRQNLVDSIRDYLQEFYLKLISGNISAVQAFLEVIPTLEIDWTRIRNTGFCPCLQRPPENVLTCGHALCDVCVRNFGTENTTFDSQYIIETCILCRRGKLMIGLKPLTAGTRVLSLDGGGVRGKISIMILSMLQGHLGNIWRLQDLFDVAYGTSVGK